MARPKAAPARAAGSPVERPEGAANSSVRPRHSHHGAGLPVGIATVVAGLVAALGGHFGSDWTVYGGNALGTGAENAATALYPLRPAWESAALAGQIFGQPLSYAGRVFVATEQDEVYALAARTGRLLWSRRVGTPVPASALPCGDISPDVGITGTPVIDPARRELFVLADERSPSTGVSHHLVGLDIYTGRVELDQRADPPRSTPAALLQRPGLALDHGDVVVAFGGNYGDCGNYHGSVAAVPEGGGDIRYYLVDSGPGERQGAIWMGGAAPVVDGEGNIWFAAGNGSSSGGPYDYSDSVTELSPSLQREQFFAPTSWAQDNRTDADLGSTAPALVDGYVFQVGKGHVAYLLERRHLGGIGGQVATMHLCHQDPHGGVAVAGDVVYVACGNAVTAVRVSRSAPHMSLLWTTPPAPSGAAVNGPPVVAGGLVWSVDAYGTLWGLRPSTGAHAVSEKTNAGEADHFPSPAVADGLLLVPTTDRVFAYQGPAGLPPAPLPS